jgi:hypothetical protein
MRVLDPSTSSIINGGRGTSVGEGVGVAVGSSVGEAVGDCKTDHDRNRQEP